MNLPVINNKMKNLDKQFRSNQNQKGMGDGFGLGIQVFKIQSVKNIDSTIKGKNRNMIKNIQNPNTVSNTKQVLIPKPKRLPSMQKSASNIPMKQRTSAFIRSNNGKQLLSDQSEKIYQKKSMGQQSKTTMGHNSFSTKKPKSSQKPSSYQKTSIMQAHLIQPKPLAKPLQLKPRQSQSKPKPTSSSQPLNQLQYIDYHSQHQIIKSFYSSYDLIYKQQLKTRRKQNQEEELTMKMLVECVLDNNDKELLDQKNRVDQKTRLDRKQTKRKNQLNLVVPITGFQYSQHDLFQFYGIDQYQANSSQLRGAFKTNNYQMVDYAPVFHHEDNQKE